MPYADDEMPSGDSTPRASGLDSRCSPSCSLTSGGPSSRRFTEYQKPSGRSGPPSRTSTAFRMAKDLRLLPFHTLPWTSYHPSVSAGNACGVKVMPAASNLMFTFSCQGETEQRTSIPA